MSLTQNNDTNNFYPKQVPQTDWACDWLFSTHRGVPKGCENDCIYCSSEDYTRRFRPEMLLYESITERLKGEWKYGDWVDCHREFDVVRRKLLPMGGIFIAPYNDIMTVPEKDIIKILELCMKSYNYHTCNGDYSNIIIQTKKPAKCFDYIDLIPAGSWLGTTIETSYWEGYDLYSRAPNPGQRYNSMVDLKYENGNKFNYFVTIEPIMQFAENLITWMERLNPKLIFIGADTGGHNLPEPTGDEVKDLILSLREFTIVECKKNLERIVGKAWMDGERLAIQQMKNGRR